MAAVDAFAEIASPVPASGGMGKQRLFGLPQSWGYCMQMPVDFFSLHRSFCPGKGWGLPGRVNGITLASPNALKSSNANTRVFNVSGAYLGHQLLLFARVDLCHSGGVLISLTFCCPCPVRSEKKTRNLCVGTGFRLDSWYTEGSRNGLSP